MYIRKCAPLMRKVILPAVYTKQHIGLAASVVMPAKSQATPIPPAIARPILLQVRGYAKSKDKKKEKGKKPVKVEINEALLREVVNFDALHSQMQKAVQHMKEDFIKHLSLRSTTGAIDTLRVTVDGVEHELQELAQISRKNPKTIVVNMIAFPQTIPDVIKAIEKSGMNLSPQQDGTTLFIPIPKVTKEHRENLSKNAKSLFIKYRDAIRDVQNNTVKKLKKQQNLSKDDQFAIQTQVTAIADSYISEADKLLDTKQKELLGDN